jgi:AAA+ ATPase superfamily predicted ATPase
MQYPLLEKIGDPDLFVGREKEFRLFNKWLSNIPKQLSKSRVILARRKSGKTALVQRIFNQLWHQNSSVIPFYFSFEEKKIWYPDLAIDYYRAFASQYISFLQRNEKWVGKRLTLEKIQQYGVTNSNELFVEDIDSLRQDKESGLHDSMWKTACSAPHRFADFYDRRILVILDEFQYITQFVYRDKSCEGKPDETLAGSYHSLSESKVAPMLVTGSYVGLLMKVISKYLEAGRLKHTRMSPYLAPVEGLQAVYQYAAFYQEPITNETAVQINELCMADPFFISCVIQSDYEGRELTTSEGVINTVHYEISERDSEMSKTWNEYLYSTLDRINDIHAKNMLLHLTQQAHRYWTPQQLKDELSLKLEKNDIQHKLVMLSEADLIDRGSSDIQFRGLTDGTLNLILRNRLEEEISGFMPDLKQDFSNKIEPKTADEMQGKLNQLSGYFAEYQVATAFRIKERFSLEEFFVNVADNTELNLTIVKQRVQIQRQDGKVFEIDIVAESRCGRVVLVEVKKRLTKSSLEMVEMFLEKVDAYQQKFPKAVILPIFLSLNGFASKAKSLCEKKGIGMAEKIEHY